MTLEDVTNIASIIGVLFTIIAVVAAIYFSQKEIKRWHADRNVETNRWHLDRSLENALRLEERFHSPSMRHARAKVAAALIPVASHEDDQSDVQEDAQPRLHAVYDEVNTLFNFFELLGYLVKEDIIEQEFAYFIFGQWLVPYWNAAEKEVLEQDPDAWKEMRALHNRFVAMGAQITPTQNNGTEKARTIKHFLSAETLSLTPQFECRTLFIRKNTGQVSSGSSSTLFPIIRKNTGQVSSGSSSTLFPIADTLFPTVGVMGPVIPPKMGPVIPPEGPPSPRIKFDIPTGPDVTDVKNLVEQGWELVAVLPKVIGEEWVFRRPKS
jgi:hypothetical protein